MIDRKKILVLTSTYPRWYGDSEPAFVHDLCRNLLGENDVHVVTPWFPGALKEEVLDGVNVHRYSYALPWGGQLAYDGGIMAKIKQKRWLMIYVFPLLLCQFLKAWQLSRSMRVDIIHAHWLFPQGLLAVLLKRFLVQPTPVVITCHGGDVYGLQHPWMQQVKKYTLRHADRVMGVSRAMVCYLQSSLGAEDVLVAPMGVYLESRFKITVPLEKRCDIVFVGRFVEKKGLSVLIKALAIINRCGLDVNLHLYGDGPLRPELIDQSVTLGVDKRVRFHGRVSHAELPAELNKYAVSVMPSVIASDGDQEGLGLVAIESMGCGCAVVASDLPAIHDSVTHGDTGILVPPGDAESLAVALQRLVGDSLLREKLVLSGNKYACEQFDWSVSAARYSRAFEGLVG